MRFLQRLVGGSAPEAQEPEQPDPVDMDAAEREHDLDLARGEQGRLDELAQRQLRYSRYAWQPPSQGGERRAEDPADPSERG